MYIWHIIFTYSHILMGLSMSLRQSITEKQTITQSIRLGQSQSMKQTIETLRGKIYSPQDDSDAIRRLIHSFLGNINDKQLKDAII